MEMTIKTKETIRKTLVDELRTMKRGEEKIFPVYKLISVRSTISRLKPVYDDMRFSCKLDPVIEGQPRTFTVTRIN